MTTIALFGATGRTGARVLARAIDGGHQVRALVRDPGNVAIRSAALTLIPGDVLDAAAVEETVAGSDAVLSLFGHRKDSPKTLQTDGTRNIVDAMRRQGVSRIVSLSGGGLRAAEDQPTAADTVIRFLLKRLSGHVLADAERHLEVLQQSGLDWTVVRGPRLLDTPATGSYRVGWVGADSSTKISRDDLADFLLSQVDDPSWSRRMPFVSA
ncbi:NAD(P)-dependent oxidoreductase [Lysobacter korlensis]|uniref:NAD(P)-dependent oxidoreductase n=1 Tax=Lysobacter korlensis TaxID=553636 RepID=A0ABV6RP36_9GAMM